MATYDIALPGASPSLQPFAKVGEGEAEPTLRLYFVHRAWNTTWRTWETWTTEDEPDPTPPSGEPITGLVIAGTWKQVA